MNGKDDDGDGRVMKIYIIRWEGRNAIIAFGAGWYIRLYGSFIGNAYISHMGLCSKC